ncbi:RDD family protein [Angustibacter aerolatus]|nr:RDD family protein [Angustibacter aerolatus]
MARRTVGSWLQGPGSVTRDPDDFPGRRLGLPAEGRGSVAGVGRRLIALCVDWAIALALSTLLFDRDQWATLGVFALEQTLLVGLVGAGVGHRLLGMQVVRVDGERPGFGLALLRAVLLSLAVPALIWDRDQRGLHDRWSGTVLRRT